MGAAPGRVETPFGHVWYSTGIGCLELLRIFVNPQHRNLGVAGFLVCQAIRTQDLSIKCIYGITPDDSEAMLWTKTRGVTTHDIQHFFSPNLHGIFGHKIVTRFLLSDNLSELTTKFQNLLLPAETGGDIANNHCYLYSGNPDQFILAKARDLKRPAVNIDHAKELLQATNYDTDFIESLNLLVAGTTDGNIPG